MFHLLSTKYVRSRGLIRFLLPVFAVTAVTAVLVVGARRASGFAAGALAGAGFFAGFVKDRPWSFSPALLADFFEDAAGFFAVLGIPFYDF